MGIVRVREILEWVDAHAPLRFAEAWDRCGLQVGDPDAVVEKLLVALDPSRKTLQEALKAGCQCLVTHHPLIFRPLQAVRLDQFPGNLVATALRKNVHLIAAHTNLDAARDGTNDQLARLMGLQCVGPLETAPAWAEDARYGGMGRIGVTPRPMTLREFSAQARAALGIVGVRVVGDLHGEIRRVALCTGSGGGLMEQAIAAGVDVYLTGDVKYHEARRAEEAGLSLVDVGHFASERIIVEPLAEHLRSRARQQGVALGVLTAESETDPFQVL